MGDSSIEWTGKVWNPITGCTKVSEGCRFCYAETFSERWRGVAGHPFEQGFDLKLWPERLGLPLSWTTPQKIFVNSMSDLFHKDVPDQFIDQVFAVMAICGADRFRCRRRNCSHEGMECEEGGASPSPLPIHTFQVLTKRADRMKEYLTDRDARGRIQDAARSLPWHCEDPEEMAASAGWPMKNVHLGVSVEDQDAADDRIPLLLQTPAAVRWISAEPLLGPINIDGHLWFSTRKLGDKYEPPRDTKLDWVVVGGESGANARPFDVMWGKMLLDQCRAAGVAFFMKQLGKVAVTDNANLWDFPEGVRVLDHGTTAAGARYKLKDPKGGDMSEWPEELRVREFPAAAPEVPA